MGTGEGGKGSGVRVGVYVRWLTEQLKQDKNRDNEYS